MAKQRLTDRTLTNSVSLQDLIHVVKTGDTSQNPAGSSFKAPLQAAFGALSSYTCTYPLVVDTVNSCSGSITINGDVTINGSATTINTQIIQSLDNNIILNYSGTHLTAIGGGITVEDGQSDGVDSTILTDSNGLWIFDPGLSANTGTIDNLTASTISVDTIGSSGDCVTDIYVSNIHSCSPLNINPLDEGNVYFGSLSAVTVDLTNNRLGVGVTSPTAKLHVTNTGLNNSFLVEDSSNPDSSPFVIDASGNVGIGLTSAAAKLDINGTTTHRDNVFIANTKEIFWSDTSAVWPTSTNNRIRWTLNNDRAEIYAFQPATDNIDFVFKISDNALTSVDNYVFWVDDFSGEAFDRYPLELSGPNVIVNPVRRYATLAPNSGASTTNFYVLKSGATSVSSSILHANPTTSRVGVNTSSPTETLDVNGKTKTTNFQMTFGATNNYVLTSDGLGNGSWNDVATLFTGNTSATCITDLYISNLYGCSPITVWDNLTLSGSVIDSQGGGYLDLRYGGSGKFYLGNDNGAYSDTFINGENGYLEMSAYDPNGRVSIYTDGGNAGISITNYSFIPNDLFIYTNTTSIESTVGGFLGLQNLLELKNDNILLQGNGMVSLTAYPHVGVGVGHPSDFLIVSNISGITFTTESIRDTNPSLLSSKFSTIVQGVKNSVGLGGYNLNVNADNTAFVDNLNIKTVGTGTSVINLGLDINGNVVTGTTTPPFTGNTSASCITDLYISNLYGCSPITIHDDLLMITGTSVSSSNGNSKIELDYNGEPNKLNITSNYQNPIASIYLDSSAPNGVAKVVSDESTFNFGYDIGTIYTGITTVTNTGIGTGLTLNVSYNSIIGLKVLEIIDGGYGYVNGDSVIVLGSDIGGTTPADDQTLTIRVVKKPNDINLEGSNVHFKTYGDEAELGLPTITEFKLNSDYFWEPTVSIKTVEENDDRGSYFSMFPTGSGLQTKRVTNLGGSTFAESQSELSVGPTSLSLNSAENVYDDVTYTYSAQYASNLNISSGIINLQVDNQLNGQFNSIYIDVVNNGGGIINTIANGNYIVFVSNLGSGICNNNGFRSDFIVTNNLVDNVQTCDGRPTAPVIVSSENSAVLSGVTNSVILGGIGITADTDDTVYVPYLNIGNIATGTSVINLGLDINGNVVTGTTGGGGGTFTGNTSATCITDIYVTNIYGCSPLHIEPSGINDVYITENGGNVGIGTTTPNYKLDVVGETRLSGAGQNILTIIGSGDTTPLFTVQGSSGELFTVTDSLVGSLFSVNNISGLPILEVFDNDTILMGSYQSPSLNSSIKINPTIGLNTVYSLPMSAYTGAWFEYTVINSGGARAGQIMSIFSGSTVKYTETTTTDIGTTTPITFSMVADGTTASLEVSATTSGWEVKTIIRSI